MRISLRVQGAPCAGRITKHGVAAVQWHTHPPSTRNLRSVCLRLLLQGFVDGRTALHAAVMRRAHAAVAELCTPMGALSISARDRHCHTPLSLAARAGDLALVTYLIGAGAPVSAAAMGPVPLVWGALHDGSWDVVRLLVAHKAPLRDAASAVNDAFLRRTLTRLLATLRDAWMVPQRIEIALRPPEPGHRRRRSCRGASRGLDHAAARDDAPAVHAALAAGGERGRAAAALRLAIESRAWSAMRACLHHCDDAACEQVTALLGYESAQALVGWFADLVTREPDRLVELRLAQAIRGLGPGPDAGAAPAKRLRTR